MLSKKDRVALFIEIHKEIEKSSTEAAEALVGDGSLGLDPMYVTVFRKVIADAIATTFFNFFTLLDGVVDPEDYDGNWPPFQISPCKEGQQEDDFLHDDFYETYWLWRKRRPNLGWKLDNETDPPKTTFEG